MQEEITKHTQKIYHTAKDKNHSWTKKIQEILIEIAIIVFAVSLSIWLHGWSEHRHQQKEVHDFYTDLKEDLANDIANFEKSDSVLTKTIENIKFIGNLTNAELDSIVKNNGSLSLESNISTTKISRGNYEGFNSSGKIGYIEDKSIKKEILQYYNEYVPNITETENFNTTQAIRMTDYWTDNFSQDIRKTVTTPKFRSLLSNLYRVSAENSQLYKKAIAQARKIMGEIE